MRTVPPLYKHLRDLGISKAYASQISNGHRVPSLKLALRVYHATGLKIGPLADKTVPTIRAMERASNLLEGAAS